MNKQIECKNCHKTFWSKAEKTIDGNGKKILIAKEYYCQSCRNIDSYWREKANKFKNQSKHKMAVSNKQEKLASTVLNDMLDVTNVNPKDYNLDSKGFLYKNDKGVSTFIFEMEKDKYLPNLLSLGFKLIRELTLTEWLKIEESSGVQIKSLNSGLIMN